MVGFCFCISIASYAHDSIEYKNLLLADSLYNTKSFDRAKIHYKSSLKIFEQNGNWEKWELCYRGLQKVARKLNDKATTTDSLPKYYSQLPKDQIAIRARCRLYRAANLDDLGSIYTALNEYKKSLETYNEITDTAQIHSSKRFINYLYKRIGTNYSRLGDQVTAIKYAKKGYEIANDSGNEKAKCDFLILIGKYLFHNNDNIEALKQYYKIQELCGDNISNSFFLAEVYLSIDSLSQAKINLDQAEKLIDESNEYWSSHYLQNYLASYFFKKGNYNDFFITKEKELSILKQQYDIRDYTKALIVYSQNLYDIGFHEKAIAFNQKALYTYSEKMDADDIWQIPTLDNSLPDIHILEAFNLKAKYFSYLYTNKENDEALERATFYYQHLFDYFDQLKSTYSSTNSQYRIGGHTQKFYVEAIQFYSTLYKTKNEQNNFEKALELAQKANAFALKNSISERKRLEIAKVPTEKINEYLHLKSQAFKNNNDSINNIQNLLQYNKVKASLFAQFPALDRYKQNQILSLLEIQEHLDNNSLLIKYFFSPNKLIRFAISKENYKLDEIELSTKFDSIVNLSQSLINDPSLWNKKKYAKISKTIYDLLLSDVLSQEKFQNKKHLIIAPDGPVKKISFSSLITEEVTDIINVRDYLVNDYEINYLYYCAQLKVTNRSDKNKEGFISFGIEYQDKFLEDLIEDYISQNTDQVNRNFSLDKLKNAKKEAISSAQILNGKSMTNSEATLDNVLTNINNYNLIHFSTHAFIDKADYLNSFIALNKGQKSEYQFKYEDILNLNLDADLVVLSACQTNSGTNIIGEGLMSLSRAFIQSGCKSSMGAYWNAPDFSTMKLMELFYSNLKKGKSKSSALRNAQIEFLNDEELSSPRTKSPFFWSSWAIYGDNTPIPKDKYSYFSFAKKSLLISIGILSLFIIFIFRKRIFSPLD